MSTDDIYGQVHPQETPELLNNALGLFDEQVAQILVEDVQEHSALQQAQEQCPHLLTRDFKLLFLRCDLFDASKAANRYVNYWEKKRLICNEDATALFEPVTLQGLDSAALTALKMGVFRLLKDKDPSGRHILFMDSSLQDWTKVDSKAMARAAAFVLHSALEDPVTQCKGIIVLIWPAKAQLAKFNRQFVSLMASSIKGAMPVRLAGVHICQPPTFFRLIFPFIQLVLGERLRKRIRIHTASDKDKLLQGLAEPYGLASNVLPTELGGTVVLDQEAWLEERRQLDK